MSRKRKDNGLLHWSKNGDMILKNKVKEAILRENTYEERSLASTLNYLDKHKTQEERHLINKRLQFASTRRKSVEKNELEFRRRRSFSDTALHTLTTRAGGEEDEGVQAKQFDAKLNWKKAITAVYFTVQNKSGNNQKQPKKSVFPPLDNGRGKQNTLRVSRGLGNGDFVLPAIKQNDTKNCLEDPRFQRLQQVLSSRSGSGKNCDKKGESQWDTRQARYRSHTYYL